MQAYMESAQVTVEVDKPTPFTRMPAVFNKTVSVKLRRDRMSGNASLTEKNEKPTEIDKEVKTSECVRKTSTNESNNTNITHKRPQARFDGFQFLSVGRRCARQKDKTETPFKVHYL